MRTRALTLLLLAGCSAALLPDRPDAAGVPPDGGAAVSDAGPADAGRPDGGPGLAAPRRWPDPPAQLTHDVDTSLEAVLETAALSGACDRVAAGASDELTVLRCGKWMFFYETFGTVGVPSVLLEFAQKHYADTFYGRGFSQLGFVPDPADAKGMPLGLAPTTGKLGSLETRAFTCASCHFGQLDDGRYAVGYANGRLDYGTFIAALGAPLALSFDANAPSVAPELRTRLQAAVAAAKAKPGYSAEAGLLGLSLLGAGNSGQLTVEEQERFLRLQPGTMDFLTKPLIDDGVWTVSRIISLWNLPDEAQRARAGMPHEGLSWNGGVKSTVEFLEGFVAIGVSSGWTRARLAPLERYLRTLRAPAALTSSGEAETGASLFVQRGCIGCHDGPSGESTRPYAFSEVGTDDAYAAIYNPGPDGKPCCGLGGDASHVTRGVKAPRMAGLFSSRRLLHNGSVAGLDELFCLAPRSTTALLAQTAKGHQMTCEGLSDAEKAALIRYLRSL